MKKIFNNLYIDTFESLDSSIEAELSDFYKNDIKYVINLTECSQLTHMHRISFVCNKIKALDLFKNSELQRIKKIAPKDRTDSEVKSRFILRDSIILKNREFLLKLGKTRDNILFVCNRNNVLSPLFVFIIMKLQGFENYIENMMRDKTLVTSHQNKCDIEKYLDKYISIIYNSNNEVSKQATQ